MIDDATKALYTPTIGIECHVQLKTDSKLFSGESNDARTAEPNSVVSHVSFGMPGALPVLNKHAVALAARAAFALNSRPQHYSKFDRKHYFYPDLPKGYQISQFEQPIVLGGNVDIVVDGEKKKIGITRAHMEEDAGKSTHPVGKDYSLVDLNRAGTPLIEIVSEPDMHTAAEAKAFAKALYLQMKYADVSEANLYHGNMRFDVNVSVSKDPSKLGTRSETKNLNSFKSVEKAVDFEISRQIELLEKGGEVVQETRGWDDAKQKTISQRTKEDAHDYRYMPEPDVPPIILTDKDIALIEDELPLLPADYRKAFSEVGLSDAVMEDILAVPDTAKAVMQVLESSDASHAKRIAFWLMQPQSDDDSSTDAKVDISTAKLVKLSQMVEDGKLNSTAAKEVLGVMLQSGEDPETIATEKSLIQVSDEGAIESIVAEVLSENQQAANDVKNGELKAIGFLVGQVMAKSKGQANPGLAQQIIKKQLGL